MSATAALSAAQRKALKARAHGLVPVVHLGGKGLSEAFFAEVERALEAHELIKLRAAALDRRARTAALEALCARLGAQPVQHIGKVLVLFRQKPGANSASGPDVQRACGSKTPPA